MRSQSQRRRAAIDGDKLIPPFARPLATVLLPGDECSEIEFPHNMDTEARPIMQIMTAAQKLRAAERLYVSARQLKAAALRAQHPDWSDEAIRRAVREAFLYARS